VIPFNTCPEAQLNAYQDSEMYVAMSQVKKGKKYHEQCGERAVND
jgi:hypothetical protein